MERKRKTGVTILFLFYLALLVWIILFKLQFSICDLDRVRSINLIPFYYENGIGADFHIKEVMENLLIFAPMGIYLQMLFCKSRLSVKIFLIAGTSLLLETVQYVLSIGRSDITDLLTNTTGGLLGMAFYGIIAWLLKSRAKTDQLFFAFAGIATVLLIGFLALLLFLNGWRSL